MMTVTHGVLTRPRKRLHPPEAETRTNRVCNTVCVHSRGPERIKQCVDAGVFDEVFSEKSVRLAQKMRVGPCIPVGIQREKAGVGPTSGPTWRLSHFRVSTARLRRGPACRIAAG
jgi:hypothetical protein